MFLPFHDDNPTRRTPVLTIGLIVVNAVVFLYSLSLGEQEEQMFVFRYGFLPARIAQFTDPRPIQVSYQELAVRPSGQPVVVEREFELPADRMAVLLSLVSCMFLHGGWMHLIGNMWFLWIYGNNVEDRLGAVWYLLLYLGGGMIASGCHWLTDPASAVPVIGASGAVAVILGAYAVTWPFARIHTLVFLFIFFTMIDLPALLVLGGWFLTQLLEATNQVDLGVSGGVAWWAHIGGFAAGAVAMPLLRAIVPEADGQPRAFSVVTAERVD